MPNVPWILEIRLHTACRGHPVALAAQTIQRGRGKMSGVGDIVALGFGRVCSAGAMAGFAAHALLGGNDCSRFGKFQCAGGVALKAAENGGIGSESLIRASRKCQLRRKCAADQSWRPAGT